MKIKILFLFIFFIVSSCNESFKKKEIISLFLSSKIKSKKKASKSKSIIPPKSATSKPITPSKDKAQTNNESRLNHKQAIEIQNDSDESKKSKPPILDEDYEVISMERVKSVNSEGSFVIVEQ